MDSNEKIKIACDKIKGDPKLKNGYHAMGLSQGSQFL
jgi:palmitoyl-protein thioesterase